MDPIRKLNATDSGDGPRTLVLANGFCTSKSSWDDIVTGIPDGWRVVRFDYAGTASTPVWAWQAGRYDTMHGHADDVVAMLEAMQVTDAVFLGHSMSAMIGAMVRVNAPELVSQLVMIGASPRYIDVEGQYRGGFSQLDVDQVIEATERDLRQWISGFAPLALGDRATPTHIENYADHLLDMRPDVAITFIRSIFLSDFRDLLARVDCPVHLLQSQDDVAVPLDVGDYMVRTLPDARLVVLPVRGHVPHMTHSHLVLPHVQRILAAA